MTICKNKNSLRFCIHTNSQTGGSGHLWKETSTADSRGGPDRCGEMGFSWPQETPPQCDSGGRQPSKSLLRPEQDTCCS